MKYLTRTQANEFFADILADAEKDSCVPATMASLGINDLWFLMTRLLGRMEMDRSPLLNNDWLYDRCCEVQAEPDGYLDLWSREH